jgi:hypothetical protein
LTAAPAGRWATLACVALLAVAAWRTAALARLAPLGPDAGFTLMKARLVEKGRVPYLDFPVGYGPFQPHVQALFFQVFGTSPDALRAQQWAHHLLLMGVLLALARAAGASGALLSFAGALYLASAVAFEGFYFILEPMVGAFGWLALGVMLAAGRLLERAGAGGRSAGLCLAVTAGALAALAAGIKQSAAVFAPLLLVLPLAGKWPRRTGAVVAAAAGLAAPFLVFFALHPSTWPRFLADSVWGIVLLAVGRRLPLEPLWLRAVSLAYTAWIPVSLAAACWLVRRRPERTTGERVLALLCAGGLAAWLPQLTRPYLHYALLPLPFAVLALAFLLAGSRPGRAPLSPSVRAVFAVLALLPLTAQGWVEGRLRRSQDEERRVAAWIDGQVPSGRSLLIVPASPQYYYLTGRPSYDERYEFFPDARAVRHAARAGAPVVVVDRAQGRYVPLYERELQDSGYRRVSVLGPHSLWVPPPPGPGGAAEPPLPELSPFPGWLPPAPAH